MAAELPFDAARSGALVVGCSRTQGDLDELATEMAELGAACRTVVADVTTRAGVASVLNLARDAFGRVDSLVNNAGRNRLRQAIDYDEAEVDALFDLNLKAVYWMSVSTARLMMSTGTRGSILNISSQAGVVAAPGRAPYGAAKAGVNHLTRTFAAEWAPFGIRVNALAPTVTATPLAVRAMEEYPDLAAETARRIVLRGRVATIEEVSRPAIFLLSQAASLITGQTLVVDGGWTL